MLAAPACAGGSPVLGGIEVPAYGIVAVDRAGGRMARAEGAAELSADGRTQRPFTSATPVRIASVSKLVVALALSMNSRIRELREKLGWSQGELAEQLEVGVVPTEATTLAAGLDLDGLEHPLLARAGQMDIG